MKHSTEFRDLLVRKALLIAPVASDALSAKIMEQTGFKIKAIKGSGISAALLGKPDVGLITMTEVVDVTERIAGSATLGSKSA